MNKRSVAPSAPNVPLSALDTNGFDDLPQPRPILIRSASELAARVHRATWLLRPYLERNSSVLVYGDLGTLKSFVSLHWGLEVAFNGEPVVYLSAEGKGLGKRIKGWARDRFADDWEAKLKTLPLFGIEQPLNLSAEDVMQNLQQQLAAGCIKPSLIIVDTVSKNSDGHVEASTEDATAYLNLSDVELRAKFECCLVLVHHTGHKEKDRARGPYALMANTDANFRIERPDAKSMIITVTAGRMKDSETPPPFSFAARLVQTGDLDEDGNTVTTLVLDPTEAVAAKAKRPTGKAQRLILTALEQRQRDTPAPAVWTIDEVRRIAGTDLEISRTTARDAIRRLIESGFLKQTVGGLALGYQP